MSYEYKLKSILLFNHIMLIVGLAYANPNWLWLSLVGWFIFGRVGGEIGLHRYLSHNSFKTGPLRRKFLIIISIFNCFGSPIHWCGIHRKHHKVSDAEGDPHGYQSMWRIWTTFWKPFVVERKYVADLVRDPFIKLIHQNYLKILITSYVILAIIDWRIAVFLISIPTVLTFHCAGAVNSICHRWGYRLFATPDKSTNNTFLNLITLGCGLHNTHHAKPSSWINGERWYEIDIPAWVIKNFLIKT